MLLSITIAFPIDDSNLGYSLLKNLGYNTSDIPTEVTDVNIPSVFDDVYTEYNKIQLNSGYDLRPFAGKTVKRYTFAIKDTQTKSEFANILIYKGKIIGGDIMTRSINGYMKGLTKNGTN